MDRRELSDELREKARACKTPQELLALVKEEGIELTDEEISAVSGGVVVGGGPNGGSSWS